ncbi:hypothetical protein [Candidatus Vondammii sp. HM_W22]
MHYIIRAREVEKRGNVQNHGAGW